MKRPILPVLLALAAGLAFAPPHAQASWLSKALHHARGDYYPGNSGYAPGYGYVPGYQYMPRYGPSYYDYSPDYAQGYDRYRPPESYWPDYRQEARPWGYREDYRGRGPDFGRPPGDAEQLVVSLYNDLLGRDPGPWEVDAWLARLDQLGGNRAKLIEEFRKAARVELQQRRPY